MYKRYMAHPSRLQLVVYGKVLISSDGKLDGHGKKQKKCERESSFTFVFIVDDRYALYLTPNAYSDVLMRIFTPYLFLQCVFNDFQCVISNYAFTRLICSSENVNLLFVLFALDHTAALFNSSSVCLAVLSVLLFVRLKSERYDIFVLK